VNEIFFHIKNPDIRFTIILEIQQEGVISIRIRLCHKDDFEQNSLEAQLCTFPCKILKVTLLPDGISGSLVDQSDP